MLNFKIKLILIELAQHKLLKQDSDKKITLKTLPTAKINKFCLLKVAKLVYFSFKFRQYKNKLSISYRLILRKKKHVVLFDGD